MKIFDAISHRQTTDTDIQPRKRVVPVWRTRKALALGALVVALGLSGFTYGLVASGAWAQGVAAATNSVIQVSADMGFTVKDILVRGRSETKTEDVLAAVGVFEGDATFALDGEAARLRLQDLAWVNTASVERQLPGTILVRLEEREPFALWQYKGRFSLLDVEGEVIVADDVARFRDLPLVVGQDAAAHVGPLIDILNTQPQLAERMTSAVRVGGRRWDVNLGSDVVVRLPEDDMAGAWARLATYDAQHKLLSGGVEVVDLRLADRLTVRTRTPQPKRKPARAKRTKT